MLPDDQNLPPIESEVNPEVKPASSPPPAVKHLKTPVEQPVEVEFTGDVVAKKEAAAQENIFNASRPDQQTVDLLTGKHTAEDLIDAILSVPEDRLIPWEEIPLPSRGLYYDGQIPGGIVKIKAMGTQADKILATARLAQTGQSIDYLLENCIQLPNKYPPAELLAGDRTFLLYALRGITHGNSYEFMINCPNCEAVQNCTYDLNDLGSTITLGNPAIREPARVTLPYLSRISGQEAWVHVRFMRGKDISVLAQRQRFNKKLQGGSIRTGTRINRGGNKGGPVQQQPQGRPVAIDQTLTENLNLIVTSFKGEVTDQNKIKALVSRLHSSDLAAIREFLKKYSPGIDTTIHVSCPDCSSEFRTELPITESFFRPTDSSGVRA